MPKGFDTESMFPLYDRQCVYLTSPFDSRPTEPERGSTPASCHCAGAAETPCDPGVGRGDERTGRDERAPCQQCDRQDFGAATDDVRDRSAPAIDDRTGGADRGARRCVTGMLLLLWV